MGINSLFFPIKRFICVYFLCNSFVSIGSSPNDGDSSEVTWTGSWQQGGLLLGQLDRGYRAFYKGFPLQETKTGQILLGLGRDADGMVNVDFLDSSGKKTTRSWEVEKREYKVQYIEGVRQDRVIPPESVSSRIGEEAQQVRNARALRSSSEAFLRGFDLPLVGPITGVYGSSRIYNGLPRSPHYGIDYAAPLGSDVKAPGSGVVTLVHDDMYFSGGTLIIDHGMGLSSTFLHLSSILVHVGDSVKLGQVIAAVGATGRATGPHLDWRMNWRDERIDPQLVLLALPAKKIGLP